MKITAYILLKDGSIIQKKINNPSEQFDVSYLVDNETKDYTYIFDRTKIFVLKKTFSTQRILFYEHGNIHPLEPNFESSMATTIDEIVSLGKSSLINDLVASAKKNGMDKNILAIILGLGVLVTIVLIVVFG